MLWILTVFLQSLFLFSSYLTVLSFMKKSERGSVGGWSVVALWWCHSLMTNDTTDPLPSLAAGLRLKYLQKWNRRCNCICIQAFKVIFQEIFWFLTTEGRETKQGSGSTLSSCQNFILNCFWYIQTLPIVHSKLVYLSAWWCQNDVISVIAVWASVFDRTVVVRFGKSCYLPDREGVVKDSVASWESWDLNMDTNSTTIRIISAYRICVEAFIF